MQKCERSVVHRLVITTCKYIQHNNQPFTQPNHTQSLLVLIHLEREKRERRERRRKRRRKREKEPTKQTLKPSNHDIRLYEYPSL